MPRLKFQYHEPRSVPEASALLTEYAGDAVLLAGGTALLIDMRHGERRPGHLISLWEIAGLNRVRANGALHLGPLMTISELADFASGRPALAGLLEASLLLGSRQVQNVATVGGNICKASPAADMVPPLLCLDAQLCLAGSEGERETRLDGFLAGPDQTAIRLDEVLTDIVVSPQAMRTGTAFLKVMRRHAVDSSIVAVATRISLAEDGRTCIEARVAVGAAAPYPFLSKSAQDTLVGAELEPDVVREAARRARDESRPITDVRASADYRRTLVETLVERTVLKAAERAAQRGDRP